MTEDRRQRIVLTTGGTGGHMFPAQALARTLIARGHRVVLITDQRGAGFGPNLPQVQTHRIAAAAVTGGGLTRKLRGLLNVGLGYLQARRLLKTLEPDAVVGFGGYAAVPATLAGAHLGRRVVLHEPNAVMGRANRLLAAKAKIIATAFEQVHGMSPGPETRVVVTGNPVRAGIAALGCRPFPVPGENDRLRLLVTGGSQGARAFNDLVPAALCRLSDALRSRLQVSQQVPGGEQEQVAARYKDCGVEAELAPFFEDMPERLAAAHLVICRSGASTAAELTIAGRPAILVPFPFAADDHQTANAQALAEAGAGWLMPQSALTAETLAERLTALLSTPALLAKAAGCARMIAQEDAAERLADLVCGLAESNGGHEQKEAAA